jgi:L-threonylcarbamoyladenylate synthase
MIPTVLAHDDLHVFQLVDTALETGQTVIFPTDTVYGMGGNPWDERALARVRTLKRRSADQPFTLHLATVDDIDRYACLDQGLRVRIARLLPGPYTLLLPASAAAPRCSVREKIVGVRVPCHPFFESIMRRLARPLFGTSVNVSGETALVDVDAIIDRFNNVDLIVTGPVGLAPSAILDLTVDPPRVVRGTCPEEVLGSL